MTLRVVYEPEAEADVRAAFHWYEERALGLGSDFLRAVKAAELRVSHNPFACQVVYDEVRRALLGRFPYALHYLVEGELVNVVACFHHHRDPAQWALRKR